MSSRIYAVKLNPDITEEVDAESNKRSLILSFVVGITLFSMGLPLLIIGSISTAEDRLAMLIPGAILFVVGAFVTIVAAVKRATTSEQDIAQQRRGSGIEILEAVPGKPVRFRVNNRPSSNDAWVGIYPVNAKDIEHGDRWGWLRDKQMDNASLPGQTEGRWSIRIFSDGGYTLHDQVEFDIVGDNQIPQPSKNPSEDGVTYCKPGPRLTYADSEVYAAKMEGRLLTLDEAKALMGGRALYPGEDQWCAVQGRDWVQVGDLYHHPGKSHNRECGGYPPWGDDANNSTYGNPSWNYVALYKAAGGTSPKPTISLSSTGQRECIEILEAVPRKPVRFRINNPPSSNDAWVGIYPSNASDQNHGAQNNRWKWLRDIDVNNASLSAQSEGNWSIRVFSDGGFTLHHREDFEIDRIPFGEQVKIKQEFNLANKEIVDIIKDGKITEEEKQKLAQFKELMEEAEKLQEIQNLREKEELKQIVKEKMNQADLVENLDKKTNQLIEEVAVESSKKIEQVQEKVLLSLDDSLSKLNDTLERLDKAVMSEDRENIISELSGSQMNLNMTVDRIDNTIGYGIDEALRGGKTIIGNIEGIPHPVSIKVPKSMNDFASGLEKGQTIEQKVTLSTFNSVRKMLEFIIDK